MRIQLLLFNVYTEKRKLMHVDELLSSYNYILPESQIAQIPSIPAHTAKMMACSVDQDWNCSKKDQIFSDLIEELDDNYLLFLNRTKVFKARIPLQNARIIRKSKKEVYLPEGEIFVYSIHSETEFECLVSDSKNFRPGAKIIFPGWVSLYSLNFTENGILFRIEGDQIFSFLEKLGEMPLPPYITYEKEKEKRYQTFFAEEIGSAAAPTASLHFTPELVRKLEEKKVWFQYLCLHVGLGTFKPIYEEHITNQKLHFEPMIVSSGIWKMIADAKQAGKIFLPIGTTMIRYLESLPYIWRFLKKKNLILSVDPATQVWRNDLTAQISDDLVAEFIPDQEVEEHLWKKSPLWRGKKEGFLPSTSPYEGGWLDSTSFMLLTRLFIRPGIPFFLTDELITNFHLPKSSLMMLISAFMGRKNLLNCYQEAIEKGYRFYSFWDWMWVKKY